MRQYLCVDEWESALWLLLTILSGPPSITHLAAGREGVVSACDVGVMDLLEGDASLGGAGIVEDPILMDAPLTSHIAQHGLVKAAMSVQHASLQRPLAGVPNKRMMLLSQKR